MPQRWFHIILRMLPGNLLHETWLRRHIQRCADCQEIDAISLPDRVCKIDPAHTAQDDLWPAVRARILEQNNGSEAARSSRPVRPSIFRPVWIAGAGLATALLIVIFSGPHKPAPLAPAGTERTAGDRILIHQVKVEGRAAKGFYYKPGNDPNRLFLWVQSEKQDG